MFTRVGAQSQKFKRKAEAAEPDELDDGGLGPPSWIISFELFKLWQKGELPPPEVLPSKAALAEMNRLKDWGRRREKELIDSEPSEPTSSPLVSPQMQQGHDAAPIYVYPRSPTQFDPAVLARAAALANGPRVA